MMRGLTGTILWGLVAAAVGVGLFFIKHEVKEQEARLAELNQEIQRNQEAIHVLKAEWSYLNDPARLRALAEKHLSMKPLAPGQVASLDSLPASFGNAVAFAAEPKAAPAPAAITKGDHKPAAKPVVAKAEPKPAAAPVKVAAARPQPLVQPMPAKPAPQRAASPAPVPVATGRVIVIQSPALAASDLSTVREER